MCELRSRALVLPLLLFAAARPAAGQIDPERRQGSPPSTGSVLHPEGEFDFCLRDTGDLN